MEMNTNVRGGKTKPISYVVLRIAHCVWRRTLLTEHDYAKQSQFERRPNEYKLALREGLRRKPPFRAPEKQSQSPACGRKLETRNPKQNRPSLRSLWPPSTLLRTASVANRK